MTEELPPLWALDMAAEKAGFGNWKLFADLTTYFPGHSTYNSIIAHARTLERLAKHEPDIVPVDEDRLALARVFRAMKATLTAERFEKGDLIYDDQAALAQFKAELAGRK